MRSIASCGLLLCASLLSGCGGYWYAAPELKAEVLAVVYAELPCGHLVNGCWNRTLQIVEVRSGLSKEDEVCVLKHEGALPAKYSHASGWNHDSRIQFRLNCGE